MTFVMRRKAPPARVINPSADAWDDFVSAQPRAHLLQLQRWGDLKSRFAWEARTIALGEPGAIQAGALVLMKPLPLRLGKMAYVPMGGYAPDAAGYAQLWDAIQAETKAALLKVEPGRLRSAEEMGLESAGFEPSRQTVQPRRTLVIDIGDADDEIMRRMSQGTRRKIRKSLRSEIEYRRGSDGDLASFNRLMRQTGERNAFGVHNAAYFETVFELFIPQYGALLLAQHAGELLAAIMVFALGDTAWYLYGASSRAKGNLYASYGIQWAAIQWAKERGCQYYDLWGVPDYDETTLEAQFRDRSDGLWGVYGFKRGWGGNLRRSAGAWDRAGNPLIYAGYRAALRLRH